MKKIIIYIIIAMAVLTVTACEEPNKTNNQCIKKADEYAKSIKETIESQKNKIVLQVNMVQKTHIYHQENMRLI